MRKPSIRDNFSRGYGWFLFDRDHEIALLSSQRDEQPATIATHVPSIARPIGAYRRLADAIRRGGVHVRVNPASDLTHVVIMNEEFIRNRQNPVFDERMIPVDLEGTFIREGIKHPVIFPPLKRYLLSPATNVVNLYNIGGEGQAGMSARYDLIDFKVILEYSEAPFKSKNTKMPHIRTRIKTLTATPGTGVAWYVVTMPQIVFPQNGQLCYSVRILAAGAGVQNWNCLPTLRNSGVYVGVQPAIANTALTLAANQCERDSISVGFQLQDAVAAPASINPGTVIVLFDGGFNT